MTLDKDLILAVVEKISLISPVCGSRMEQVVERLDFGYLLSLLTADISDKEGNNDT